MTKEQRIEWLFYLFKKSSFAYLEALEELSRRGMTDAEQFEFIDEINRKYERVYEGKKFD